MLLDSMIDADRIVKAVWMMQRRNRMEYCKLGMSGVEAPVMGVGTMLWLPGKKLTEDELFAAYQKCVDEGLDLFDTAEIYGNGTSERLLGEFQRKDGRSVRIATKFAPPSSMNPLKQKRACRADAPEALMEALDASLKRLGRDSVELYQMHMPPRNGKIDAYMDVMAQAVREGKVRAVGVCNFSKEQIEEAASALEKHGVPLATAMVGYNILRRYPETNGVFEVCRRHGITVIPYAPLAEGTLTGKYRSGKPVPIQYAVTSYFGHLNITGERNDGTLFWQRVFSKPREVDIKRMEPLMKVMEEVARAHDKTIAQVALNWLLTTQEAEGVHVLPIPGTKSVRQAVDNAGAADWKMTAEERETICKAEQEL